MSRTVALAVDLGASGGRIVSGAFDGRMAWCRRPLKKRAHRFIPVALMALPSSMPIGSP